MEIDKYLHLIRSDDQLKFEGNDERIHFVDLTRDGFWDKVRTFFYEAKWNTKHVVVQAEIGGEVKKIALEVDDLAKALHLNKKDLLYAKKREAVPHLVQVHAARAQEQKLLRIDQTNWGISAWRDLPRTLLSTLKGKQGHGAFTYDSIGFDKEGHCTIQPQKKTENYVIPFFSFAKEDHYLTRLEHDSCFGEMVEGWTCPLDFRDSYQAFMKGDLAACRHIAEQRDVYNMGLVIIQSFCGERARIDVYESGELSVDVKQRLHKIGFTEGAITHLGNMISHDYRKRPSLEDADRPFS